ncbi:MAG: hypothetical protein KC588_18145 [Nitrospira sp.]|nr:hypothetical protein [Nitrospira sp.]
MMPRPTCQHNKALQPYSEEYPQKPLPHPPTLEERYAYYRLRDWLWSLKKSRAV